MTLFARFFEKRFSTYSRKSPDERTHRQGLKPCPLLTSRTPGRRRRIWLPCANPTASSGATVLVEEHDRLCQQLVDAGTKKLNLASARTASWPAVPDPSDVGPRERPPRDLFRLRRKMQAPLTTGWNWPPCAPRRSRCFDAAAAPWARGCCFPWVWLAQPHRPYRRGTDRQRLMYVNQRLMTVRKAPYTVLA